MPSQAQNRISPPLVCFAAWLVPGLGYWLIGQRSRGMAIGVSILSLFALGVLVGGIRVVDPPGWGEYGYKVQLVDRTTRKGGASSIIRVDPVSPEEEEQPSGNDSDFRYRPMGWALMDQFTAEVGNKPWFVGQILCGPISVAMSAVSIHEAHPVDGKEYGTLEARVPASHSRSWEIGTLYTAVAGMLNLLAIIDCTSRAGRPEEK